MENYKFISFIVSGLIFSVYWIYIYFKYGIQKSISDSYYVLEKRGILFTLALWGFSLPLMIIGENGLMFFSGAFICFAGAAAEFKKKMTDMVHVVGAVGGIIFGILSLLFVFNQILIVALMILFSSSISYFNINNKIWWIETVAFIGIFTGLLISNL